MVMPASVQSGERGSRLADPALRREVEAVVRRRVRGNDAEDVVQAALADVLSAEQVPEDREEFRRYVFGVTRNKVYDHFRKRMREVPEEEGLDPPAPEAPLSAHDLLRWAEQKLPDAEAEHTLEWMLREGDGEKLEQIARDANVPAPRVRQRVSRLRRLLRERWAAELMLGLLGVGLLAPLAVHYYRHWQAQQEIVELPRPEPLPTPEQRGRELRKLALRRCERLEDRACLDELDRAATLDPSGDHASDVVNARRAATARLAPPPPSVPPSSSAPPPRRTPRPSSTESSLMLGTPMPSSAPDNQK